MRLLPPCLLAGLLPLACSHPPPAPPNVVLIVVDTLRADLGGERAGSPSAPHIDRLAASGVAFSLAFCHAPITLPAHVALFSSRPPHATGVLGNGRPVPEELPLLAEHLRTHGYRTHAVTSLGTVSPNPARGHSISRGFDTFVQAGWGYITPGERVCERLEEALDQLRGRAPFFLFAHFSDPHEPYNDHRLPPDTAALSIDGEPLATLTASNMSIWRRELELAPGAHRLELTASVPLRLRRLDLEHGDGRLPYRLLRGQMKVPASELELEFSVPAGGADTVGVSLWLTDHPRRPEIPARYGSEVSYVDHQIGRFLEALSARDLDGNTLVVFTADHGESLGERRFIGHVKSLGDEVLRVPLVFRLPPGLGGAGALARRKGELVGHVDVVPTLLDLLGLPPLPGQQGRSLLGTSGAGPILAETHPPDAPRHLVALRDEALKLVYDASDDRFVFYDLAADPEEENGSAPGPGRVDPRWRALLRSAAAEGREAARSAAPLTPEAAAVLSGLGYAE